MNSAKCLFTCFLAIALFCSLTKAQQAAAPTAGGASAVVPRLIKFSGTLLDEQGHAMKGPVGVTFALCAQQSGGAALWMETQNVKPDSSGNYTVLLGATSVNGIPEELFASGQARWLGIQPEGQGEQPRVLLVSVPYALKAGDAQTLGGLPPSAFLTASSQNGNATAPISASVVTTPLVVQPSSIMAAPTGSGNTNTIPLWTNSTNLGNSNITQVGGIVSVKDTLQLPATGTATSTLKFNSQPLDLLASSFSSTLSTAINQHFRWQAEPVGNNTTAPSGKLNLLFARGASVPAETGLSISSKGLFTFAPGQTFPGTGTVTSVGLSAPASDFKVSGSPVTKSGTLALSWKVAPTSADIKNAIVKRDSSGSFAAGAITANLGVTGLSAGGPAVFGQNSGTGGFSDGVHGVTSSAGASGVAGVNNSGGIGVFGVGGIGTFGTSNTANGIGVNGVSGGNSVTGAGIGTTAVWGDAGKGIGVVGTADDNIAIFAHNNSFAESLQAQNFSQTSGALVFRAIGVPGGFVKECDIDTGANLTCDGTKSAVVPVENGQKMVALYAEESPENWFADYGSGQLVNGVTTVVLESTYAQTVNTSIEYHVFLTPKGDCKGLYVTNQTQGSFEVHELQGGHSSIAFDYRVIAKRKGYEKVRLEDKTAMRKAAEANAARFRRKPVAPGKLPASATK